LQNVEFISLRTNCAFNQIGFVMAAKICLSGSLRIDPLDAATAPAIFNS